MSVVRERLNKSASCSEIPFLNIFKTLPGILYGTVDLLISRDERINLISSFLVGENKNVSGFSEVISILFMCLFYFCLGLF